MTDILGNSYGSSEVADSQSGDFMADANVNSYSQAVNTGGINGSGQTDLSQFNPSNINSMGELLNRYNESFAPLGVDASFPDRNRGVMVGSGSTKTWGTDPNYTAGGGLMPFNILDARNQAKALAEEQQKEDYISALDLQYAGIKDKMKNQSFVNIQRDAYGQLYKKYTDQFGAVKGAIMARNSQEYKDLVLKFSDYQTHFDTYFDEMVDLNKKVQNPDLYVPKQFRGLHDEFFAPVGGNNLTLEDIEKLDMRKFRSYQSFNKAVDKYDDDLDKRSTDMIVSARSQGARSTNTNDLYFIKTKEGWDVTDETDKKVLMQMSQDILNSEYANAPDNEKPEVTDIYKTLASRLYAKTQLKNFTVGKEDYYGKAYAEAKGKQDAEKVIITPVEKDEYTVNNVIDNTQGVEGKAPVSVTFKNAKVWNYDESVAPTLQIGTGKVVKGYQIVQSNEGGKKSYMGVGTQIEYKLDQNGQIAVDENNSPIVLSKKSVLIPASQVASSLISKGGKYRNAVPPELLNDNVKSEKIATNKSVATKTEEAKIGAKELGTTKIGSVTYPTYQDESGVEFYINTNGDRVNIGSKKNTEEVKTGELDNL